MSELQVTDRLHDRGQVGNRFMRFLTIPLVLLSLSVAASLALAADGTRVTTCGVISSYAPATTSAPGSITIGTHPLALASGSSVSSVNPAITVGARGCFAGTLSAAGTYSDYGVEPLPASMCGTVSAYTPATSATDGAIQLGSTALVRFTIPRGTSLPATYASGSHCVTLGLSSAGDAIVTGAADTPNVQVGAASSPQPASSSLPSTSTSGGPNTGWLFGAAALVALALLVLTPLVRRALR